MGGAGSHFRVLPVGSPGSRTKQRPYPRRRWPLSTQTPGPRTAPRRSSWPCLRRSRGFSGLPVFTSARSVTLKGYKTKGMAGSHRVFWFRGWQIRGSNQTSQPLCFRAPMLGKPRPTLRSKSRLVNVTVCLSKLSAKAAFCIRRSTESLAMDEHDILVPQAMQVLVLGHRRRIMI